MCQWFFKLLDVHKTGALDPFAVRYFFREIGRALEEYGFEAPDTTAIQAEIYDMARCRDPSKGITWEELRGSGVGHIVVLMLVDVHGFLNYDQRENAAASQAAAAAAEEEAALAAAQQAQAAQAVAADSETVVTDDWGGEDAGALQQGGVGSAEGGDGGDSEEGGFERQEEEEGEEEAEEAEGEEEN